MSDEGGREVISESYRRRVRLMDRLLAPFDVVHAIELLLVAGGLIGAVVWALKAW